MRSAVKKSKTQNLVLSLNNQILDKVCSYKYLGFALDEHLNFNKHVSDMKQLITHKLYLVSKIRRYITVEASINIFKTMILSVIEYGNIIYYLHLTPILMPLKNYFIGAYVYILTPTTIHLSLTYLVLVKLQLWNKGSGVIFYYLCINKKVKKHCLKRRQEIQDCMKNQCLILISPIMKGLGKMFCIEVLSNGMY